MYIRMLIISFLAYMILFNSSLTFRLKWKDNIVIAAISLLNIVIIRNQIGNLFVIPMFMLIIFYVCYLKKEDWLWNTFLIISSYILMVIVDNLIHLVLSMIGWDPIIYWPVYLLISYPVFFVVCRFMSKKAVQIKNNQFLPLSPRILAVIGTDIMLCMLIFVIHIRIAEQAGSSPQILLVSIILYITYAILTFLMIITIVHEYETNANMMLKQNSYDNLQEYMAQIEELYQNIRIFRHDYANIMASMAGYMQENDMDGLKAYYDRQIFPMSNLFNKEKDAVSKLHNLGIIELKSLISVKINYALEMKIDVNVEITERIDQIKMKNVDLVRIMGILLDNAIEACQECEKPNLGLSMIKTDKDIAIIIKNTYVKQDIDYSKLGSLGMSSKGKRRGIGLHNMKMIINAYDNVVMDTEFEDGYFTQELEIYG